MIERIKNNRTVQYRRIAQPRNPGSQGIAKYGRWEFRVLGLFEEWREVKNYEILKSLDRDV